MMCVVSPGYVRETIRCHGSCITDLSDAYAQVIFFQEGFIYDIMPNSDYDYNVTLVSETDDTNYFSLFLERITAPDAGISD